MTRSSSIVRPVLRADLGANRVEDSGHGGQTKDLDGDEADGYDEGLFWRKYCPGHLLSRHSHLSGGL